MWSGCGNN
uniref:Uncharacterized protein n=1 Tax=Anguilla anguilla TaxID=7936 RepID=A0A0E9PN61_ANGAN